MAYLQGLDPVLALLATLFTWGITALGATPVFFAKTLSQRLLDTMLGFAAGVMIAASFWSLLEPAIKTAGTSWERSTLLVLAVTLHNIPRARPWPCLCAVKDFSRFKAFIYGQFSGMVEPVGGVLGAWFVLSMHSLLPYAMLWPLQQEP